MSAELLEPGQLAEIRALSTIRPAFPEQMLGLFMESANEALEGCLGAWMSGDSRQLQAFAHRLKGTAASFGASRLRQQAESLENDAELEVQIKRQRLDAIERTIAETHQAYADWLQQPAG